MDQNGKKIFGHFNIYLLNISNKLDAYKFFAKILKYIEYVSIRIVLNNASLQ